MIAKKVLIPYGIATLLLLVSLIADITKTKLALKKAWNQFSRIAPHLALLVILVSISLYFFKEKAIFKIIGRNSGFKDIFIASLLGSVAAMPGFVVFPIAGILKQLGVAWAVIASFTNSLMLVGILTFPLEQKVLGIKLALLRNLFSFVLAIGVAIIIGLALGDKF